MIIPQHIADELSKGATALGDAEYHLRRFHETIPDFDEDAWERVGRLLDMVKEAWGRAQDAELACDEYNCAARHSGSGDSE